MKHYTNSEIFNSYIKIATASDADDSKKALDANPRADSLTKERIGELYNVTNDTPKDMQYKRNIMEDAHPGSYIAAPAYDRLNALVENNNQRQDIMLRIVDKRTNGLLTQHKYAQDELVLSLVRLANYLDNKNETELASLADDCLEDLKKKVAFEFSDLLSGTGTEAAVNPLLSAIRTDILTIPLALGIAAVVPGLSVGLGAAQAGAYVGAIGGAFFSYLFGTEPVANDIAAAASHVKEAIKDVEQPTMFFKGVRNSENKELLSNLEKSANNLVVLSKNYANAMTEFGNQLLDSKHEEFDKLKSLKSQISGPVAEKRKILKQAIDQFEKLYDLYKQSISRIQSDHDSGASDVVVKLRNYFSPLHRKINPVNYLTYSLDGLKSQTKNLLSLKEESTAAATSIVDKVKSFAGIKSEEDGIEGETSSLLSDEREGGSEDAVSSILTNSLNQLIQFSGIREEYAKASPEERQRMLDAAKKELLEHTPGDKVEAGKKIDELFSKLKASAPAAPTPKAAHLQQMVKLIKQSK